MSFTVDEGEVVGLIGPNGAGKTTAFNVITGFLRPTRGEIRYRGQRLNGLRPHEVAEAGLVRTFQKTSVFAVNTVFENILIGLHRRGRATPWQTLLGLPGVRGRGAAPRDEARAILDFVGIAHRAGELGGALPYGEQRLLEVAIALAAQPVDAAARRAGLRHEPFGDLELHAAARAHPRAAASPCCWSSTTCAWSWASPTASSCSTRARSSPKGRRPRSRATPK